MNASDVDCTTVSTCVAIMDDSRKTEFAARLYSARIYDHELGHSCAREIANLSSASRRMSLDLVWIIAIRGDLHHWC